MSPSSVLRHAAADAEVRAEMLAAPEAFGVSAGTVPASVEPLDEETLDFWTEGVAATEVYACASSCSAGPFTIICDGGTK
ncbi:cinnamycin family lantibiotic [Actinoallomurus sp. NPDC052308]|uniref:cinnamycin family lantibiotic n=1 Tax=Actinoallomurus sp. NPDC052308 TaxID=3155530 RepID=UPI00342B9F70